MSTPSDKENGEESEGGRRSGPGSKDDVRPRLLEQRRELSDREQRSASRRVARRLSEWSEAAGYDSVGAYLSFDGEVDVSTYIASLLEAGARVGLPRVLDDQQMHFVPIDDLEQVREGAFGIREPVGEPAEIACFDLFLVPGVGFDRDGHRIGMGWGYYDRALQRRRDAPDADPALFVGVCYDFQLLDTSIPVEAHDVPMDVIVTPNEIIDCTD